MRGIVRHFFSKYPLAWGWGTWRRAWSLFDPLIRSWPQFRAQPEANALFDSADERHYWLSTFARLYEDQTIGKPISWDYAWYYACMTNGLSIHPVSNLVSNIGHGPLASNTRDVTELSNRPTEPLEDGLVHPDWIVRDRQADLDTFDRRFPGALLKQQRSFRHQMGRPARWALRMVRRGLGGGRHLIDVPTPTADVRTERRVRSDVFVLVGLGTILVIAAWSRHEFLGDGVRHLPAILSDHIQAGEPRWLLFPVLAHLWVRMLSAVGLVNGAESSLRAVLTLCVASGILFLGFLLIWLRTECKEATRRTAALLLAGSCAPFLLLFTDIAEPQIAAAVAAAGLAFARVHRDDPCRSPAAVMSAAGAIAFASLIYQGVILALGMLPLVATRQTLGRRSVAAAVVFAVVAPAAAMIAAQIAIGAAPRAAIAMTFNGESNPMTRTFMASSSPVKYVVAAVMGPPQGIVALENFAGLKALWRALTSSDSRAASSGALNVARLFLGFTITVLLLFRAVRDRRWRVLVAVAVLLALPVFRNQQYGYVKFYVLWPIPVALLAVHCRARTMLILATTVLVVNGWLVAHAIGQGRERLIAARTTYARATSSTCWLTSGWAPPFSYTWPGTTATILGTLATGHQPAVQADFLTRSLRRCLCESTAVWTDTTTRDAEVVTAIAQHFGYTSIDLASVLLDPSAAEGRPLMPGVLEYSERARIRACRAVSR